MSEKALSQAVVDCARLLGWRVYRTFDSRRSPAGFPDLVCARPPRLLVAELKRERGRLTPEQVLWLADFRACGAEVHVWYPADWLGGIVEAILRG